MRRYLVALMAVGAVTLAGCGSSSGGKTTSNTEQTLQSASPSTTAAPTSAALVAVASTSLGQTLVDAKGMTLYRFDKDSPPTIACVATCATTWPPVTAPSGATTVSASGVSDLALIARPDGAQQLTHQGHPLYRFSGDTKAGDTHGDGFGGIWHAELAAGAAASPSPATTQAPAQTTPTTKAGSGGPYYP
jgi:predicted lipoprotein with Yx(FWY)xxD motif